MSIRKQIEELFQTDWASIPVLKDLRVIATERELDSVDQPTALIRIKRMEREPSAPMSARRVGLLLTIISEHVDLDEAGDDLEDYAEVAMEYLSTRFMHDPVEVVGYGDRLAIDIPLTIITVPEAPAEPEPETPEE